MSLLKIRSTDWGYNSMQPFLDQWSIDIAPPFHLDCSLDISNLIGLGSCFARNISRWLIHHGYKNKLDPWDTLFHPFAINSELIRLNDSTYDSNMNYLISTTSFQPKYFDPYRTWLTANHQKDLYAQNIEFSKNAKLLIKKASCVVITLGLCEIWQSKNYSFIPNCFPENTYKNTGEWQPLIPSIETISDEILSIANNIYILVGKVIPIIVSISPIPMKHTGLNSSIYEVNYLSKAKLRVALDLAICNDNNIKYFPAYEIISYLGNNNFSIWQADHRHISASAINIVANKFVQGLNIPLKNLPAERFWVPKVNKFGSKVGKMYV